MAKEKGASKKASGVKKVTGSRKGKGGRPSKEDGESATRQVRVFHDLADMIGDIIDVQGGSAANLVDPFLRPSVLALHNTLKPLIDQMKKLRAQANQTRQSDDQKLAD
jgi:hypothetical protein